MHIVDWTAEMATAGASGVQPRSDNANAADTNSAAIEDMEVPA
jgi:hypothetical protein